jgi:hypothetical protein
VTCKSLEYCTSAKPIWTKIFANNFESDLGNFNDGGNDARLYHGKKYSHGRGSNSLELRDGSMTSLSVTDPFPVSNYTSLKVKFWYRSRGLNRRSNGFFLQSAEGDAGTDWVEQGHWRFTSNNKWRSATVKFPINTGTMRIRFMNDGTNNKEKIYIDDVTVLGN